MVQCLLTAGLSEAILRGNGNPTMGSLGDKGLSFLKTIKNSSHHLNNIINDILDAASLAKGKLILKAERVSFPLFLEPVVSCCMLTLF